MRRAIVPLALLLSVLVASRAGAVGNYALESSFGKVGSGEGEFRFPQNAAVQQTTGTLFVADVGNSRVQAFGLKGEYAQITGAEVPGGLLEVDGVAVDNAPGSASAGDLYVADRGRSVVDKFKPRGPLLSEGYEYVCHFTGTGEGGGCVKEGGLPTEALAEPPSVAVDANGNVYVAQYVGPVVEYDSEGSYLATLGPSIVAASGIAVNASGSAIYVASLFGTLIKLEVDPVLHAVTSEVVIVHEEGATAVAVDQENGDLFVDQGAGGVKEYEEASVENGEVPLEEFGKGEIGESVGVAYSSVGNGKVYVTDIIGGEVHVFSPEVSGLRPETICTGAEEVGAETAVLSCAVEPKSEPLEWAFEYRTTGTATWTRTPGGTAPGLGSVEDVREGVKGLQPETDYVFRIVASNAHGTMTSAPAKLLTLPGVPGITQCEASNVTSESATLEASLAPVVSDLPVTYAFEYGDNGVVGEHETLSTSVSKAGQLAAVREVPGLEPNKTYKCRLTASGDEGTSRGTVGTFKTPIARPLVTDQPLTASSITRKTAVLHGTINPENSETKYHFVYVADALYDPSAENPYHAAVSTVEVGAGGGFGDEMVSSSQLVGLRAGTTYHYALVASNEAGVASTETIHDYTFTTAARTPPEVSIPEEDAVSTTSAVFSDVINPKGLPTSYEAELGTEVGGRIEYSSVEFGQVVQGYATVTVRLDGLASGTTYHYRVVATNEDTTSEEVEMGSGPSVGQSRVFTTPGIPGLVEQAPAVTLLPTPSTPFPAEFHPKKPTKKVTRAQRLRKALKSCGRRTVKLRKECMLEARKKYGSRVKGMR